MQVLAAVALALLLAAPSGQDPQVDASWGDRGVDATATTPGAEAPPNPHSDAQSAGAEATEPEHEYITGVGTWASRCDSPDNCPGATAPATPPPSAPGTPALSDVARFLKGAPTATYEPGAFTLAGAETNFIAAAGEREQSGQLLGRPVVVHFTPVAYDWRYGDGTEQITTTPGATWQASDLPNFAKTATSHVYQTRGVYTATVTVEFAARYQFAGQGWVAIPGTLGLTSGPLTVTVKGVKTVLVGKTCDENPTGPGC